jgi:DNA (cytosine-5)-methyltransferase 1
MTQQALFPTPRPVYDHGLLSDWTGVAPHGLRAVATFSGCGGSSLGLVGAGWRVVYAVEFVEAARTSYVANFPTTPVDSRDIRAVRGAEIAEAVGEVDLLEGSPPCSPFSIAGSRDAGWGKVKSYSDTRQRTDDLFFEWARLVAELRPRAVLAENVPSLATGGSAARYLLPLLGGLRRLGYSVAVRVLSADHFGVPQSRDRLVVVGFRADTGIEAWRVWPERLPHSFTLADALAAAGPSPEDELVAASMERYAVGAEWRRLPVGGHSDRYLNLVRPDPARPCPTVTQTGAAPHAASVAHPHECRKFTPTELRAICGFPRDFVLTGDPEQQYERLGRAVPPPMYAAVARRMADLLLDAASTGPSTSALGAGHAS